ncbi:MAG: winged helix-turn-helix transcriptional regulator [Chloroflexi bacterium]|nr:winged helix-turn-helix transcriptional regulator [Chloroflexota bacterium]
MTNISERFYGRELAQRLGEHFNAVWQELRNLEEIGLVKAEEEARRKYYVVNTAFPLYPELRALILKAQASTAVSPAAAPARPPRPGQAEKPKGAEFIIGEVD